METKKTNKAEKPAVKKPKEVLSDGKVIVIQTNDKPLKESNYTIAVDGSIVQGKGAKDEHIIICLVGSNINWTQIKAMIKIIQEHQSKGAAKVERFDTFHPGEINPVFNLRHALIKYGVR